MKRNVLFLIFVVSVQMVFPSNGSAANSGHTIVLADASNVQQPSGLVRAVVRTCQSECRRQLNKCECGKQVNECCDGCCECCKCCFVPCVTNSSVCCYNECLKPCCRMCARHPKITIACLCYLCAAKIMDQPNPPPANSTDSMQ